MISAGMDDEAKPTALYPSMIRGILHLLNKLNTSHVKTWFLLLSSL